MIRYALRCEDGHEFDGWFRSAADFDRLHAAGQVACALCGGARVAKALMAPAVAAAAEASPSRPPLAPDPETPLERLRRHVEANSDYVGVRFADEARAMHEGRAESRAIHGEARPEDARALIEDGIPVAPLPFLPRQKAN